jgi:hypothetical protein
MRHRELALGSALKLKAEQDRKAAMGRVADGFEQAIGIVQAVSSEIEVAAGNLNRTAEANNTLIGWDRDRARPAVGEGFPVLLFRLQSGSQSHHGVRFSTPP